jgi:primosomal protein N' (replication factor Y)
MFAEVVLSKVTRNIDKIYHYSIPAELKDKIKIGDQVLVPFGYRQETGYVVGFVGAAEVKKVKDIIEITSEYPLFSEKQVRLAKWLSEYYCSFFISALRLVMPAGTAAREGKSKKSKSKKQIAAESVAPGKTQAPLALKEEQQKALTEISAAIDSNKTAKILLYGVTGSGKTEVYMQAIDKVLQLEKSAIVLVPEIALTPQLVQRFSARFGDHIAVLHSHLTLKQRQEEWQRIAASQARIVLGARSAIFAPVKALGLIVIDEEYENSYKQDKNPRYHVREVAFELARLQQAVVVMGSATPALETYYKAETGEYRKISLPQRIDHRSLPPVEVIDMRKDRGFLLSEKLRAELKETLTRREQAILFINRRGYFTFIMCASCGFTIECPHCSIALTYHSSDSQLHCSRCDYRTKPPAACPRCNTGALKYIGTGTQRIEKEVAEVYPAARILRYDSDAVSKRGSHELFFAAFAEGKADVLIGTQMVAKGLDVANVTLVGVISADTALHIPDFRAAERTFQLLTQVAGRAGRHHLPGKVIIQTYTPDHYAIRAAAKHDYEEFYKKEIEYRRELGYPPFSKLINLLVSGPEMKKVAKIADDLKQFLVKRIPQNILGPAPAPIPRLRGDWRYQMLLKGQDLDQLRAAVVDTLAKVVVPIEVRVTVDVEPMGML